MHRRTWIIIGGLVIAMALLAAEALVGGGLAIARPWAGIECCSPDFGHRFTKVDPRRAGSYQ